MLAAFLSAAIIGCGLNRPSSADGRLGDCNRLLTLWVTQGDPAPKPYTVVGEIVYLAQDGSEPLRSCRVREALENLVADKWPNQEVHALVRVHYETTGRQGEIRITGLAIRYEKPQPMKISPPIPAHG
jgi:hypothetical protein